MSELPNRIRELRSDRQWSQSALAERVGCSKVQISDLERGNRGLDLDWMRRIANAFEVSPADLLTQKDNPDHLSPEEREFIQRFRAMGSAEREMLQRVADVHPTYQAEDQQQSAA